MTTAIIVVLVLGLVAYLGFVFGTTQRDMDRNIADAVERDLALEQIRIGWVRAILDELEEEARKTAFKADFGLTGDLARHEAAVTFELTRRVRKALSDRHA